MSGVLVFGAGGDLHVFASEDHAAGWMEAVDVEAGEYATAYLLDGTVVELATDGERVLLRRTERGDLPGLIASLRAHRRRIGDPEDVDDLVAFANDVLRREWEGRWPRRPRWVARRFPATGPPRVEEGCR